VLLGQLACVEGNPISLTALSGPPRLLLTRTFSPPGSAAEAGRSREGWTEGGRRWRQRHARADPRRRIYDPSCGAGERTGQGQGKGDAGTSWAWEGGTECGTFTLPALFLDGTLFFPGCPFSGPGQASNLSFFQAVPNISFQCHRSRTVHVCL
jgi:hypothetical protein